MSAKVPCFASLEDASVSQIVDVMEYSVLKSGEVLCRQGDAADRMFVIVSGECAVRIDGARIAVLKEHDVFGESALFPDASGCFREICHCQGEWTDGAIIGAAQSRSGKIDFVWCIKCRLCSGTREGGRDAAIGE